LNASPSQTGAAPATVETEARSAPVVIFSSEFTDLRPILRRLDERQIAHREIIVNAAPTAPLDRYGDLRALTGWQTLPQVFVEGAFVGGYEEILRHPLIQQAAAPRSQTPAEVSGMAKALGYGGLAPFLLGAELLWWIPDRTSALWVGSLLSAYAAVILSFLGAVHWGRVVAREPGIENPRRLLALGVLPSLGGWGAMFSPVGTALLLQAFLLALVMLMDRSLFGGLAGVSWYLRLRRRLTLGAVALLLLAWLALIRG
jgi:glutaredoxin-related protein